MATEEQPFKVIDVPRPVFKQYPVHRDEWVKRIAALKEDQCLECDGHRTSAFYTVAKAAGIKITTKRQPDGKLRIWRVK